MSIFKTKKDPIDNLIKNLKKYRDKFKSNIALFIELKRHPFSRIDLMILDSILKGMPLTNLHNTLLLPKDNFDLIIKDLDLKIKNLL